MTEFRAIKRVSYDSVLFVCLLTLGAHAQRGLWVLGLSVRLCTRVLALIIYSQLILRIIRESARPRPLINGARPLITCGACAYYVFCAHMVRKRAQSLARIAKAS